MAVGGVVDRGRWARAAEWLAMAVAASLPWSTSASSILIVLWLLALISTLNQGHWQHDGYAGCSAAGCLGGARLLRDDLGRCRCRGANEPDQVVPAPARHSAA